MSYQAGVEPTAGIAFVISHHAVERYRERVDPCLSAHDARDAIKRHARVIGIAIAFRCRRIKLGNGARLALEGSTIVTVLSPGRSAGAAS